MTHQLHRVTSCQHHNCSRVTDTFEIVLVKSFKHEIPQSNSKVRSWWNKAKREKEKKEDILPQWEDRHTECDLYLAFNHQQTHPCGFMLHLTSESLDCVLNTLQSPGRTDQTNWQVKLQPPQVAYFQDLKCWGTWASACSQDHHTNDSSEERSWTQSLKDEIGPLRTGPALGPFQVQHL